MKNICDWNNCFEIGKYKAPVEKDNSRKFKLLCLSHIKEFNKNSLLKNRLETMGGNLDLKGKKKLTV